ncbi:CerR family C-terminal domain-containing protein [Solimonas marina]|uniref:CerR family C-terminal domain-containing protein n=1 Tax=Solimonas marina TaxID=2714601 RepID=A0A969W8W4_9GAMM|nr:CerR family C-terminal domain-containing protein [Solimonas marina]NKF22542.1 CerR family C-terminal domain-containing protein [Solimonas marina]
MRERDDRWLQAAATKGGAESGAADGTRRALIDAATAVFVEQGYAGARVRDIAARAQANVAAINYHFGGKQRLYLAVLREQAGARIERFPLPVASDADVDEQTLRDAIAMVLSRFLAGDERAAVPKLLMRELLAPTSALEMLVSEIALPQFRHLATIVAALLGPAADPETVLRCTLSIVSQCMFYLFARPLVEQLAPHSYADGAERQLAEHIARFSLAALRQRRAELEGKADD